MSYSVDLWSSYNKIEKRLELNFHGLKEFIILISEYYSVISKFTTNLKKVYDLKCSSSNESLQIGINGFKTDILNQYLALNDYLNSIKDDINQRKYITMNSNIFFIIINSNDIFFIIFFL